MKKKDYEKAINEEIEYCQSILLKKGLEYQSNEDVFNNFVKGETLLKDTKEKVLFSYLMKHLISLSDMVDKPDCYSFPIWREKLTDSINYLLILYSMVKENVQNDK